jgi:hypothetical protein
MVEPPDPQTSARSMPSKFGDVHPLVISTLWDGSSNVFPIDSLAFKLFLCRRKRHQWCRTCAILLAPWHSTATGACGSFLLRQSMNRRLTLVSLRNAVCSPPSGVSLPLQACCCLAVASRRWEHSLRSVSYPRLRIPDRASQAAASARRRIQVSIPPAGEHTL